MNRSVSTFVTANHPFEAYPRNETPSQPPLRGGNPLLPITWQLSRKPFKPIPTRYRLDIIALAVSPISSISIGSRLMPVHPLSPVERPFLRALYAPARTHARTHTAVGTHRTHWTARVYMHFARQNQWRLETGSVHVRPPGACTHTRVHARGVSSGVGANSRA